MRSAKPAKLSTSQDLQLRTGQLNAKNYQPCGEF